MNKQPTTPTPTPTQTQKATEPSFYPELTRVRDEVLARAYAEGLIKRPKPVTNNHDHEQTANNNN